MNFRLHQKQSILSCSRYIYLTTKDEMDTTAEGKGGEDILYVHDVRTVSTDVRTFRFISDQKR